MKSNSTLSIIVADDHPSVKYGIKGILCDLKYISRIDEASNGREVLSLLEKKNYDIIVMDISMPLLDGIETTKIIKETYPEVKVIALSMYNEERYVRKILESGGSGYLLKNADKEEIIDAINIVWDGGTFISKDISISAFQKMLDPLNNKTEQKLILDEVLREVIFLLCAEKNSDEIAKLLSLSKKSIDKYREHIHYRIGAKNVAGIVKYGIKHGISDDIILKQKFLKVMEDNH